MLDSICQWNHLSKEISSLEVFLVCFLFFVLFACLFCFIRLKINFLNSYRTSLAIFILGGLVICNFWRIDLFHPHCCMEGHWVLYIVILQMSVRSVVLSLFLVLIILSSLFLFLSLSHHVCQSCQRFIHFIVSPPPTKRTSILVLLIAFFVFSFIGFALHYLILLVLGLFCALFLLF